MNQTKGPSFFSDKASAGIRHCGLFSVLALLVFGCPSSRADWPEFRGQSCFPGTGLAKLKKGEGCCLGHFDHYAAQVGCEMART